MKKDDPGAAGLDVRLLIGGVTHRFPTKRSTEVPQKNDQQRRLVREIPKRLAVLTDGDSHSRLASFSGVPGSLGSWHARTLTCFSPVAMPSNFAELLSLS